MCRRHEAMVPAPIRLQMVRAFKAEGYPGDVSHPTRDWLHALTAAIEAVTQREDVESANRGWERVKRHRRRKS